MIIDVIAAWMFLVVPWICSKDSEDIRHHKTFSAKKASSCMNHSETIPGISPHYIYQPVPLPWLGTSRTKWRWRFPKMGVPPNHPFQWDFPLQTINFLGAPHSRKTPGMFCWDIAGRPSIAVKLPAVKTSDRPRNSSKRSAMLEMEMLSLDDRNMVMPCCCHYI